MTSLARILDANLNRAREGLRMMEDAARFVLDSAELCGVCKSLRHGIARIPAELAGSVPGLDQGGLLAARDTPADVGARISTDAEMRRPSLSSVVTAAACRVAEALRVIEETSKLAGCPPAAALAEQCRYRSYELHKRLTLALGSPAQSQWPLCVLLSESLCAHHAWQRVAELAIEGGAACLQLREKSLPDAQLLRRARDLLAIARPSGAAVVINDRVDLALLAGADGVHLGQEDMPLIEARRLAGFSLLIGVSTGTIAQARAAAAAGADCCGVGPMFPTNTKHKPDIAGPGYLREYLADPGTSRVPHLAIGGIGPENICGLVREGCRGVAVSSGVCSAADPAEVCRLLRRELSGGRAPGRPGAAAGVA